MRLKTPLSFGFIVHAFLGNICMMPMAFAAEMPMPHEEHREMAMTPAVPMTPADCDGCMTIRAVDGGSPSCAGRCLSQTTDTTVRAAPSALQDTVAPVLSSITVVQDAPREAAVLPPATAPPVALQTRTIVLLQ